MTKSESHAELPEPSFFRIVRDAIKNPLVLFTKARRDYGDYVLFNFGAKRKIALISDPDGIRHVLVERVKNYPKSDDYKKLIPLLGRGLVTVDETGWKKQRQLVNPMFHRSRSKQFAAQITDVVEETLERWRAYDDQKLVDIHAEMMQLTFLIIGRTLLSSDLIGVLADIAKGVEEGLSFAVRPISIPLWLPTPGNLRFKKTLKLLNAKVAALISHRKSTDVEHDDLLTLLIGAQRDGSKDSLPDTQIRDEIVTMLAAGHETTANLLTWTFMLLSQHDDVLQMAVREIENVVGDRTPSLEDLPQLKYCRSILEETLRLYPPLWGIQRTTLENDVIKGFNIRKGTTIAISPYVVQRHPDHWSNPDGFDPSRFQTERSKDRSRYAYIPFGAGHRNCIGGDFAMMEAQLILAMVLRKFCLRVQDNQSMEPKAVITLRPKFGSMARLTAREST